MTSPNPLNHHHDPAIVMEVFSTITSPTFSELVLVHTGYAVGSLPQGVTLFETLREMHKVRRFKLVFLLEVDDIWDARRELAEALDSVADKGLLDFLDSPPTVRTIRPRYCRWDSIDFD